MTLTDHRQAANIARRHRDRCMAKFAATGDRQHLSDALNAQEAVRAAGRAAADQFLAAPASTATVA